jgi:hypothetical protein
LNIRSFAGDAHEPRRERGEGFVQRLGAGRVGTASPPSIMLARGAISREPRLQRRRGLGLRLLPAARLDNLSRPLPKMDGVFFS